MEYKHFNENRFSKCPIKLEQPEEPFVQDWEILLDRHKGTAWELLREMCVELNFPIAENQKNNPEFLTALKYGILPSCNKGAWYPVSPEGIKIYLHSTPAGRLPVIECENDLDFIHLQQSLVYRCEPLAVPDSRGATIIKNYNNWARIKMHRNGLTGGIPKDPALYRDYIALLSHRNYSGVSPEVFGLDSDDWRKKSFILRREHEAAHYMTQRFYNSAKNEIHDEIIADFMGITAAFGDYDPIKFITFLGLENYPDYRSGGRLEIYFPTCVENFTEMCATIIQATENIAVYYKNSDKDRMQMFHTLCHTSVADMAGGGFE